MQLNFLEVTKFYKKATYLMQLNFVCKLTPQPLTACSFDWWLMAGAGLF
jgi:hypothetical protein